MAVETKTWDGRGKKGLVAAGVRVVTVQTLPCIRGWVRVGGVASAVNFGVAINTKSSGAFDQQVLVSTLMRVMALRTKAVSDGLVNGHRSFDLIRDFRVALCACTGHGFSEQTIVVGSMCRVTFPACSLGKRRVHFVALYDFHLGVVAIGTE